MTSDSIGLSLAQVTDAEIDLVVDALRSGWVAPLGPHVDAFETEVAERVGVRHALALSSGTAALHLALLHLGARPGTCVVTSSMTFAATANAVVYCGAEPVFVDSCEDDGNVDPHLMLDTVRTLQDEGRDVVAALPVDLFGRACDYRVLEPGLAELGVPLLEDAAEALGSTLDGRAAGSFGSAAILSFNGNKILTTSGGGMLLSDDAELVDHARSLSTQAREPVAWYEHVEIGYNYRLSNVLAALGRGQLGRLKTMIDRRREVRARYAAGLEQLPLRVLGHPVDDRHDDNCWLTSVVLDEQPAAPVVHALNAAGIEARHLWKPMHLQPVFAGARAVVDGRSERLFARGINLPSGSGLTDEQVERVIATLHQQLS